jgi:hypothetical protein
MFGRERRWDSYSFEDVIGYFLQTYPSISFVLTVTAYWGQSGVEIKTALYEGMSFKSIGDAALSDLSRVHEFLPVPLRDAKNAVYYLRDVPPHKGDSFAGGLEGGANYIKLSARTILGLLAGTITQERFSEIYPALPFAGELEDGRLINGVEFKKGENEKDDDWLVFKFGNADPAVSPFTVPKKR